MTGATDRDAPLSAAELAETHHCTTFLQETLTPLITSFSKRGQLTVATMLLGSVMASIGALAPDDATKAEFVERTLDLVRELSNEPLEASQ